MAAKFSEVSLRKRGRGERVALARTGKLNASIRVNKPKEEGGSPGEKKGDSPQGEKGPAWKQNKGKEPIKLFLVEEQTRRKERGLKKIRGRR